MQKWLRQAEEEKKKPTRTGYQIHILLGSFASAIKRFGQETIDITAHLVVCACVLALMVKQWTIHHEKRFLLTINECRQLTELSISELNKYNEHTFISHFNNVGAFFPSFSSNLLDWQIFLIFFFFKSMNFCPKYIISYFSHPEHWISSCLQISRKNIKTQTKLFFTFDIDIANSDPFPLT